jgi:hypothetical protein
MERKVIPGQHRTHYWPTLRVCLGLQGLTGTPESLEEDWAEWRARGTWPGRWGSWIGEGKGHLEMPASQSPEVFSLEFLKPLLAHSVDEANQPSCPAAWMGNQIRTQLACLRSLKSWQHQSDAVQRWGKGFGGSRGPGPISADCDPGRRIIGVSLALHPHQPPPQFSVVTRVEYFSTYRKTATDGLWQLLLRRRSQNSPPPPTFPAAAPAVGRGGGQAARGVT